MIINNYLADTNESEIINITGSYKLIPWTKNIDDSISHICGLESPIYLEIPEAIIGKYYKIVFTLEIDEEPAGVYIRLGHNKGEVKTSNGTYTEYMKMTGETVLYFFASGLLTLSNIEFEEYKVISDILDFTDKEAFINSSWTLSYSLDTNNWVSFHSYIPDYYISTSNGLYSLMNDELSIEYTIRDEDNNYIVDVDNSVFIYEIYNYE